MTCVFARDGDLYVPTAQARGPWDPAAMHGGAPAALIARAVEDVGGGMRIARLTVEFLGAVPLAPVTVDAQITRPGRRMQVAEVSLSAGGREACRARASLIRAEDTEGVPARGGASPDGAEPDALERSGFLGKTGDAFNITAMDIRFARGGFDEDGPALAWFRFDRPFVLGEEASPAQLAVAAADFGNGVSSVLDWDAWLFVNTDLTVHLARDPVGEWVALDARTVVEDNGAGLSTSTLYDRSGPFGVAAQSLFVARR